MCGIAGIINFSAPEQKESLLRQMAQSLHHRGPDAQGIFTNGPAGLGHTRLSIIDIAGGDQPVHNEDESIQVVFNGEIFNYPELKETLLSKGHRFYTRTDTEVLVHLYEEYGSELFNHLNGQFAFALWDMHRETLLLGRDRTGIRPLFYFHDNGRLVFASEIKAIFADEQIKREIDIQTLSDIFTCWTPQGSATAFTDIYQLPPAHYATFSKAGFYVKRYWELPFGCAKFSDRSLPELTDQFNQLMLDAIRIRLRADVPVGAYLSGGIDSTYICSIIKNNFHNRLSTFSVGFTEKQFDETAFQSKAVAHSGTNHHSIDCSNEAIGRILPEVIWHTETPLLRTAPAPLMLLSRLVRDNQYKVVLTGEGADEILAGYNIFKENKIRRFWARQPDSKVRPLLLATLYPYIFSQKNIKAINFLEHFYKKNLSHLDMPAYSHLPRWENTSALQRFFSKDIQQKGFDITHFINRYNDSLPQDFMSWDPLPRAQYIETQLFMSNYLLSSQGDRMSMANSIEGRYPFLDHRVIEFAAKIPSHLKLYGLTEKYILKKAAHGLIPPELIQRSKQPYRAPVSQAFLGDTHHDYVHELLSEKNLKESGYFDPGKTARLIKKCRQKQGGMVSERENMALAGILSTQLLDYHFIKRFPRACHDH